MYVWTKASDTEWRLARRRGRHWPGCRFNVGPGHRTCKVDATVELNRGQVRRGKRHDLWYGYCDEHAARHGATRHGPDVWHWQFREEKRR